MLNRNEEPRGGSVMWLLTVLVIVLATKVDSTVADIVVLALATYAMRADHISRS